MPIAFKPHDYQKEALAHLYKDGKPGQDSAVYDGEKIVFFGQRIIERAKP